MNRQRSAPYRASWSKAAMPIVRPRRWASDERAKDVMAAARPIYELYGKAGHLDAFHPDGMHDFPADARKRAYEFLDKYLKLDDATQGRVFPQGFDRVRHWTDIVSGPKIVPPSTLGSICAFAVMSGQPAPGACACP